MLRDRGWPILYGISVASGDASMTALIAARTVDAVLGGSVFESSISPQTRCVATHRHVPTRLGAQTNAALLALLALAFLTGWLAFAFGTSPARLSLVVHATSGVAILLLLP